MKATSINRWLEAVAAEHGPRIAITFLRDGRAETEMTYAQLQSDVNRLANTLLDLGVQKGDRVVLFIPKSLIAVVAHFATQAIGAMAVPLNPVFKQNEMAYLLGDTDARLIIVEPEKKAPPSPRETADTFVDGWFRTGDLGKIDTAKKFPGIQWVRYSRKK